MPDLATLRDDLGKVLARANSIVEQYKSGGLPAEKTLELDVLTKKAGDLKRDIEQESKLEQKKKDLANLDEFLNKPEHKVPHGVGDGGDGELSDERKALAKAGWECKNGILLAPTSTGKHVEMFQEEVLFGPIPEDDASAAVFFKQTRAAMRPEYRVAYQKMIRLAARVPIGASPLMLMSAAEQKALSEGTDPSGGFLVPPDVQAEMLVRVAQEAIFRGKAKVQTTSRDILKFPAVQANASSGSIYSSGFVGGWAGETPVFSDTDPQFGSFDIPVKKLRVATRLSNDFVADAAVNVLAFMAQNGAENMALVEDSGFINGDGSPLQPRGIVNANGVTTTDITGTTANQVSNTAANIGSATKIIDLCYLLPPQYLKGAEWIFRRSVEGKIRKLIDAQGRFIWPPYTGSGFGATPRDLLAYPISNSDFMPADGTANNRPILFGDLSKAYIIAQRAQVTSTVLRERFADTDQIGIILWERVGGDTWNPDAIRIGTS